MSSANIPFSKVCFALFGLRWVCMGMSYCPWVTVSIVGGFTVVHLIGWLLRRRKSPPGSPFSTTQPMNLCAQQNNIHFEPGFDVTRFDTLPHINRFQRTDRKFKKEGTK